MDRAQSCSTSVHGVARSSDFSVWIRPHDRTQTLARGDQARAARIEIWQDNSDNAGSTRTMGICASQSRAFILVAPKEGGGDLARTGRVPALGFLAKNLPEDSGRIV